MMKKIGHIRSGLLGAWFLTMAACLLLGAAPVPAAAEAQDAVGEQRPEAREILLKMADFLARTPGLGVTIDSRYDAIQQDGQRIEFGAKRRILLHRPDGLRVEVERSDGDRGLVLFDGQTITAFKADENVYARVKKPGSVDKALVYMVRDLQMTIPLARMFVTTFPLELEKWLKSVSYVEEDTLFDIPVDHLAARTGEVDFQVWVDQGERPLPRRVVITYRNAPGQPQFRAEFSDWKIAPEVSAANFTFNPPKGAEHIPFLAPLKMGSLPSRKGEKP